jgi:hypothetical protein
MKIRGFKEIASWRLRMKGGIEWRRFTNDSWIRLPRPVRRSCLRELCALPWWKHV